MVSIEASVQSPLGSIDAPSSPRISFQADFLEASIFSSIITQDDDERDPERQAINADFEFLLSNNLSLNNNNSNSNSMTLLTADELFSEGKILPFWQMQQHSEKLKKISLRAKEETEEVEEEDEDGEKENDPVKKEQEEQPQVIKKKEEGESDKVMNWLVDEDPSPRPPNCTVLWKELLRLKKQRSSSSSSSSSVSVLSPSSSSSSSSSSLSDTASKQEGIKEKKQVVKGMKKLERTRSTRSIRIRPMINVPICTTQVKTSSLPPLFSHKKRK